MSFPALWPAELYRKLYEKSLEGGADCGGVLVCNYLAGEGVTHMDAGRPMVVRRPDAVQQDGPRLGELPGALAGGEHLRQQVRQLPGQLPGRRQPVELLQHGIEGDAGTGMTATNAVAPRTGNVSAGTSIFSMVVLEKPLEKVYEEIDLVTTPAGAPVAMVHCNNCTNDTNAWVSVLGGGHIALAHHRGLEQPAVARQGVDGHALLRQDVHADFQRGHGGVELGPALRHGPSGGVYAAKERGREPGGLFGQPRLCRRLRLHRGAGDGYSGGI